MEDRRGFFGKAFAMVLGWLGVGVAAPMPELPPTESPRIMLSFLDPRGIRLPVGAGLVRCYTHCLYEDGVEMISISAAFTWQGDNPCKMVDDLTIELNRSAAPCCRSIRGLAGHAYGYTYYADYAFVLSAFPEQE